MGLFGALFAGVSGLDSQSNKIGVISNNIANSNTIGFKQGQAAFDTLVVASAGTTTFSPGGVIGSSQDLVNQQGIISATTSPTDIAISGGGLMVVNTEANGSGQTLYTRAGSFTQDSNGNFVNANGYYLQGLPITSTGATAQANAQNLTTVAVSQSATGAATATSTVTLAANLDATQSVLLGPGESRSINSADQTNNTNTATQIIVPSGFNNLVSGEAFSITTAGDAKGTTSSTYTYGGFTYGRSVTTPADLGLSGTSLDTESNVTISAL